jgi:NTE family protein
MQNLTPGTFTTAVAPLLDALQKKLADSGKDFRISDICDCPDTNNPSPRQYVNLVQEGGGVHGIALAGYTYILEKMGIGFVKMAGTSAGAINTLLLNSVLRQDEALKLNISGKYYETRSEKLVEYLVNKDLSDLIDGAPVWKKLILSMFSGNVGLGPVTKQLKAYKMRLFATVGLISLMLLLSVGLLTSTGDPALTSVLKWTTGITGGILLMLLTGWIGRGFWARYLWRHAELLGINPGDNFENWIKDILKENGIRTVEDMKQRMKDLYKAYKLEYDYKPKQGPFIPDDNTVMDMPFIKQILADIEDEKISIDYVLDRVKEHFPVTDVIQHAKLQTLSPYILEAFQKRTKKMLDSGKKGHNFFTREVVIVSSDITNEIKVEFPGMHRMYWGDDMSISPASYVRASMSIPFFFKPFRVKFNPGQKVAIQQEWDKYMQVKKALEEEACFVDGGVLSNFPINVFADPSILIPRLPTVGIKLEYQDETSINNEVKSIQDLVGGLISTMRYFYDRDFIFKNDSYKKTVRSVDTGKIHWLNFNLTDKEKIELFYRGALSATIFLADSCGFSTNELTELMQFGKAVQYEAEQPPLSIYGDNGQVDFKIEDCQLENVTFNWQEYKVGRLDALLAQSIRKQQLKDNAAGKLHNADSDPILETEKIDTVTTL